MYWGQPLPTSHAWERIPVVYGSMVAAFQMQMRFCFWLLALVGQVAQSHQSGRVSKILSEPGTALLKARATSLVALAPVPQTYPVRFVGGVPPLLDSMACRDMLCMLGASRCMGLCGRLRLSAPLEVCSAEPSCRCLRVSKQDRSSWLPCLAAVWSPLGTRTKTSP